MMIITAIITTKGKNQKMKNDEDMNSNANKRKMQSLNYSKGKVVLRVRTATTITIPLIKRRQLTIITATRSTHDKINYRRSPLQFILWASSAKIQFSAATMPRD